MSKKTIKIGGKTYALDTVVHEYINRVESENEKMRKKEVLIIAELDHLKSVIKSIFTRFPVCTIENLGLFMNFKEQMEKDYGKSFWKNPKRKTEGE